MSSDTSKQTDSDSDSRTDQHDTISGHQTRLWGALSDSWTLPASALNAYFADSTADVPAYRFLAGAPLYQHQLRDGLGAVYTRLEAPYQPSLVGDLLDTLEACLETEMGVSQQEQRRPAPGPLGIEENSTAIPRLLGPDRREASSSDGSSDGTDSGGDHGHGYDNDLGDIADAVLVGTAVAQADVLGSLLEDLDRTAERYLNQFFTPTHIANATATFGAITRQCFEPPTASPANATGQTGLSVFGQGDSADTADTASEEATQTDGSTTGDMTDAPAPAPTDGEVFTVFDFACGSGRLLIEGARYAASRGRTPVVLGWERGAQAARLAALNCAMLDLPALIIRGDAVPLEVSSIYRVAPHDDTISDPYERLQIDADAVPELPAAADRDQVASGDVTVSGPVCDALGSLLQYGANLCLQNPPFDSYDLDQEMPAGATRDIERLANAHRDCDLESPLSSSEHLCWLFLELGSAYTAHSGAGATVMPTSALGRHADKPNRVWIGGDKPEAAHQLWLGGVVELDRSAFQPATNTGVSIVATTPRRPGRTSLDHPIFMGATTSTGSGSDGTLTPYRDDDGNTVSGGISRRTPRHALLAVQGHDEITMPDDDLPPLAKSYWMHLHPAVDTDDS